MTTQTLNKKEKVTNYIFSDDFLLQNDTARLLYHDHAVRMPVIDYHNHLSVEQIATDYSFKNMTDIWLKGDHYKWRAMRTLGVDERYITGDATDEDKFLEWARIVPETLRNPLFHWTHLELKNPFGVEYYLNKDTAKDVYGYCQALLQKPNFSARGLLEHYDVKTVCTTDDPSDSLAYHRQIKEDGFGIKVLPGFRPDSALHIFKTAQFRDYIQRLSEVGRLDINSFDDLLAVLQERIAFFDRNGCKVADHGLNHVPVFDINREKETDEIFQRVLKGADDISEREIEQYTGMLLYYLCQMYHEKGWVQQFHLGPLRNTNSKKLRNFGPDTGFDSIGDFQQSLGLSAFLDQLEKAGKLGKTILYNVNPADNEMFATMPGNFNEGPGKGKVQYGAAWWFMDQLDGMERQINALSNMGVLSCFVGMLTDSRSFLSFSRHDYFRRLLCNIFGKDIEAGLLPNDEKWIGKIIEDICFNNAKGYFGF